MEFPEGTGLFTIGFAITLNSMAATKKRNLTEEKMSEFFSDIHKISGNHPVIKDLKIALIADHTKLWDIYSATILLEETLELIASTVEHLIDNGLNEEEPLADILSNTHPSPTLARCHEIERNAHLIVMCATMTIANGLQTESK